MTQTSSMWSRGLLCAFLISAGLLQISAVHSNGLPCPEQPGRNLTYYLSTEITNPRFKDSLLDPNSTYYKNLTSEIDDVLTTAFYNGLHCIDYQGTGDISFSKGHQIKVETTISFLLHQPDINIYVIQNIFVNYMKEHKNIPFTIDTTSSATNVSESPFTTTTKSPSTLLSYTTTVVSTTETPPTTFTTETTSSRSRSGGTSHSPSSDTSTAFPLPSPTSSQGQGTNGTTSVAATNHTTPLHNHTTDSTANASTAPGTTTPDSRATNASNTLSASSASKHTANHQKVPNSTTTTPYPLVPYWLDWVPGWGIALLVLASLILLLLIILIIMLLLRWCCMDEPEAAPRNDLYPHSPYSSHSPAKTPIINVAHDVSRTPEKPKGNRTGMYVVNP